jgi:para-nitrobenzyl esterase
MTRTFLVLMALTTATGCGGRGDRKDTGLADTSQPSIVPADTTAAAPVPVQPAADSSPGQAATGAGLAGTTWRLVQFRSMDDKTVTPDQPDKYTVAFGADGKVRVKADCNRGHGTWTSSAPNALHFGPLATTRAMCPPGSMSDRFLRDFGHMTSYVLKDGKLHISLMADGGIYDFEPAS